MPQIYDMGPTALLPLQRKACWGFFHPKNPTASAGFEPANLGTKGQHATPRPPNRSIQNYNFACCFVWVWNLATHIVGGMYTEGVWEQGVEENIWP